ncbi:pseudaminic acid synthase [Campylobacter hepaticus]|uniref:Pseudaminic acid synthase n=1 Tax=Campylobacter hepaticus TaxID=1813019 RepID=A0A6A7JQS5_9BACT|nr:pseudaminic acid synthase [Campylobacter hepaticus]AXP08234.1 pseudaminic acid synthase [Campylobacter hepaticus]MCZ0772053.1 pseudaminic acid synthase [Campylobacter hepaticus]MCZ0773522.1 pseudaminic acid synthase [Campylobacter hepaticus]MCZ0774772.1 pseudaminic acid synthase [Campylobacter hepaticus]MDX2322652.1 pseudaminic acid synthase [Campylobacter hepaticus]
MQIGNFNTNKKVFIIAELSANHSGSLDLALKSIKAAKQAGADAIKIQTYTPDSLTLNSDKEDFIIKGGLWDKRKLYELYDNAKTPYEWHSQIFETAQNEGILCFSSPFAKKDVEFLKRFDPIAYKIASFEVNDEDFIRYVAKENKTTLISTGIATQEELSRVCEIFKEENNPNLIFLKCTSAYPADLSDMNLKSIISLKEKFKVEVGLSDHSFGFLAPIIAVSLGAKIIEKHFIIDKSIKSEDREFSLDFKEFKSMVDAIRQTEKALGDDRLILDEKSLKNRVFARSLYASKDIKKGEVFSQHNVKSVRPSFGLHPKFYQELLGKKATKDIEFAQALKESDFK